MFNDFFAWLYGYAALSGRDFGDALYDKEGYALPGFLIFIIGIGLAAIFYIILNGRLIGPNPMFRTDGWWVVGSICLLYC